MEIILLCFVGLSALLSLLIAPQAICGCRGEFICLYCKDCYQYTYTDKRTCQYCLRRLR